MEQTGRYLWKWQNYAAKWINFQKNIQSIWRVRIKLFICVIIWINNDILVAFASGFVQVFN